MTTPLDRYATQRGESAARLLAEALAIDEETTRRLLDDLLGTAPPPPPARARRLKARRRWHERHLAELSRKVDAELDRIDRIDLELTGSPPVIIW